MKSAAIICMVLLTLAGCSGNSDIDQYNKLVKKELAGNKRTDSLFYGIYLGMPEQLFFQHCWKMNKQNVFSDGSDGQGNMYVLHKLDKELKHPAAMNFYPDFRDSAIWRMRVNIQYSGWAPWNKTMYADSLLPDVLNMLKQWYPKGNPFISLKDEQKGTIYVKVDGNRRITVGRYDDIVVKIDYTDMLVEKKLKDKDAK